MRKSLVLTGMMGVGKTTAGKNVAKKLSLEFIDTDLFIEKKCSMKISEIFKKKGEKFFRNEEEKEVLKLIKKKNIIAKDLFTKKYKIRIVKPKKGKGSFKRKKCST